MISKITILEFSQNNVFSLEDVSRQQKINRKVWVIVLISFLFGKLYPYPHINLVVRKKSGKSCSIPFRKGGFHM